MLERDITIYVSLQVDGKCQQVVLMAPTFVSVGNVHVSLENFFRSARFSNSVLGQ